MDEVTDGQEMRRRWLELWDEISHLIALFEADYGTSTPESQAAAARLAAHARAEVAKVRRRMEGEHPDLPTVADRAEEIAAAHAQDRGLIDVLETLFSHLVDGDGSLDDAELTAVEQSALERSRLTPSDFIAARARLRGLVDKIPEELRARALALIVAQRRDRN